MENAIDALKMAFAMFVFIIALTVSITMFSELNQTSKVLINARDITTYYHYEKSNNKTRTVGLESIIPTLYKYYTENYTVLFLNKDGTPLKLYKSKTDIKEWGSGDVDGDGDCDTVGVIGKYYSNNSDTNPVCTFDLGEETLRHEPWTGNTADIKANLDAFLNGKTVNYKIKGMTVEYNYSKDGAGNAIGSFYEEYSDDKFKEILGEYNYNLETEEESEGIVNSLLKGKKKRVIIYQLLP